MSQESAVRERAPTKPDYPMPPDRRSPLVTTTPPSTVSMTTSTAKMTDEEMFILFQSAFTDPHSARSADAWQQICEQYMGLVASWARKHGLFKLTGEEPDYFAAQAFTNMWIYFAEGKGDVERFPDLRSLLKFLMVCVNNAIVDHHRKYVMRTAPDDSQAENPAEQLPDSQPRLTQIEREELWQAIYQEAQTDLERLFIYGYFELLLPRRKIADLFPQFEDVHAVKQVMDTFLKRLRRNESLKHFLEAYRWD